MTTHALRSAEIPEEPVDVVTCGFGSTDAALALGYLAALSAAA